MLQPPLVTFFSNFFLFIFDFLFFFFIFIPVAKSSTRVRVRTPVASRRLCFPCSLPRRRGVEAIVWARPREQPPIPHPGSPVTSKRRFERYLPPTRDSRAPSEALATSRRQFRRLQPLWISRRLRQLIRTPSIGFTPIFLDDGNSCCGCLWLGESRLEIIDAISIVLECHRGGGDGDPPVGFKLHIESKQTIEIIIRFELTCLPSYEP